MSNVLTADISKGFKELGIKGKSVVVHSSLSSFGEVKGGAEAVADALLSSFRTILMPVFCWDSVAAPPENDRPRQNGCDYRYYDTWDRKPIPFVIEKAGIEPCMGIISRYFLTVSGVKRSDHAWHSWAVYGDSGESLIKQHSWDTTNLPLERLAELDANILLLGVGLSSCTAIHIAEEMLGRRPFIRWAMDRNGEIKRVRSASCGKGFNNLFPFCEDLFKTTTIGRCRALTVPLKPFLERAVSVILSNPEVTRCSLNCIRCRDAILGGPIE